MRMKLLLVSGGAVILFGVASFFPYGLVYDIALFVMEYSAGAGFELGPNFIRWKLTLFTLPLVLVLAGMMFLLYKVSITMKLKIFKRLFKAGAFYVGITTVLMLAGMWIDFHIGPPSGAWDIFYGFSRVGFFFYTFYMVASRSGFAKESLEADPGEGITWQLVTFIFVILASAQSLNVPLLVIIIAILGKSLSGINLPKTQKTLGWVDVGLASAGLIFVLIIFLSWDNWSGSGYILTGHFFTAKPILYLYLHWDIASMIF